MQGDQAQFVGNQTGGRVFLFLYAENFECDYLAYKVKGVIFVRERKVESYGTVVVFKDIYANLWDLLQPKSTRPDAATWLGASPSTVGRKWCSMAVASVDVSNTKFPAS